MYLGWLIHISWLSAKSSKKDPSEPIARDPPAQGKQPETGLAMDGKDGRTQPGNKGERLDRWRLLLCITYPLLIPITPTGFLGLLFAIHRCHLTHLFGFDLLLSPSPVDRKKPCHYFESTKCLLDKFHPVQVERPLALAMGQLRMVEGNTSYFLEIKGCPEVE